MAYRTLVYEKQDHLVRLTLNRPDRGNLIDLETADELADACREINQDEDVRAAVITGKGSVFCSGSDLSGIAAVAARDMRKVNPASVASEAVSGVNCPVLAAINGEASGAGLELALACDIRICSEDARFCFPETSRGLIPGGGGTQRLPRIVGRGKALEMVLLAAPIDAREAHRIGLVSRVTPGESLIEDAETITRQLLARAPIALRFAKEAVRMGMDMTLRQGLRLEADLSFILQTTADRSEGIRAFLDKRKPEFRGE
ncbi:MAG: enoyl-CoA hydratase/isomerase family protein [Dehalococcoidia bacterium]|nr:enoyl-CoA hydratase/isomerase family protein [Dehalococcoidia bacterium]